MRFKVLYLLFVSILISSSSFGQSPFVLNSTLTEETTLVPHIEMSFEKGASITIEDIDSNRVAFESYNFEKVPVGSSTIWLRLQIQNKTAVQQSLTILTSRFDLLEFYFSNGKKVIGGNHYPNKGKEFIYRNNTYAPFVIEGNETIDCYIKAVFQDKADLHFEAIPQEFAIVNTADLVSEKESRDLSLWILCGAVAVMFCYNLLLFVLARDKGYMYYAFFTVVIFFFNLAFSGKFIEMMPSAELNELFQNYAGFLALSGMILFYRKLFNLRERFPLYDKITKGLLVYYALCFPLVYFGFNSFVVSTGPLAWLSVYVISFIIAIKLGRQGNLTAKYFMIGNGVYFLFAVVAMLQTIGQLPPTFLGIKPYTFTISGSIVELILFSLSLGAKMNEMQNNLLNKEIELRHEEEKRREKKRIGEQTKSASRRKGTRTYV
ncbi:7TMR-DISM family protein [Sediminitomix flava]|uniref:7TMR-DISM extracellular protein 2 n=1 Tax=Sediminitomix flava TaxID=379075 RepID=A0A315ZDE9_SEDFL|nr:7TM diverse intracellular signaling domain-containing protein [Sediminitomix flava]PWJ43149.1 7TMR-DISM extracellular protein 2 [Sediminitomix flava]